MNQLQSANVNHSNIRKSSKTFSVSKYLLFPQIQENVEVEKLLMRPKSNRKTAQLLAVSKILPYLWQLKKKLEKTVRKNYISAHVPPCLNFESDAKKMYAMCTQHALRHMRGRDKKLFFNTPICQNHGSFFFNFFLFIKHPRVEIRAEKMVT